MDERTRTILVVSLVVVVMLLLLFGGGMVTGTMMSGGMMGRGMMGRGMMGGINWMWIPTLLILGLGVLLGWAIFGKR